ARRERSSRLHPRSMEAAEGARAEASIRQRTARREETALPMRNMLVEISFSDWSSPPGAQPLLHSPSVNGSAGGAWIKLDLAERDLVVRHVLLQERHKRLGLLRAQINALKVPQFHLRLRALLHGPKHQEEIPHIDADLHAVGVSLAVIGSLHKLHVRLVRRIHIPQCNASVERRAKLRVSRQEELVRKGGLEPPWVSPPDPKSGASANSATFAGAEFP